MIGYIAKDGDGKLYLYPKKPTYHDGFECWYSIPGGIDITGQFHEFDSMSYTDKPIKVEINIKRL